MVDDSARPLVGNAPRLAEKAKGPEALSTLDAPGVFSDFVPSLFPGRMGYQPYGGVAVALITELAVVEDRAFQYEKAAHAQTSRKSMCG